MTKQNKKTNIWEERLNAFINKLDWLAYELDIFADNLASGEEEPFLFSESFEELFEEHKSELEGNIEIIQNAAEDVRYVVESLEDVAESLEEVFNWKHISSMSKAQWDFTTQNKSLRC